MKKNNNENNTNTNRNMMSTVEASEYTAHSEAFFRCGRCTGHLGNHVPLPQHYKIGRKVLYKKEDLDQWLEQFRVKQQAA